MVRKGVEAVVGQGGTNATAIEFTVGRGYHRSLGEAEECVMFDAASVQVLAGSFLWCLKAIGVYLVLGMRMDSRVTNPQVDRGL